MHNYGILEISCKSAYTHQQILSLSLSLSLSLPLSLPPSLPLLTPSLSSLPLSLPPPYTPEELASPQVPSSLLLCHTHLSHICTECCSYKVENT